MSLIKIKILILIVGFAVTLSSQSQDVFESMRSGDSSKDEKPLRVAISKFYYPQTFLDVDGQPSGVLVDVWRLWSEKTGRKIEFVVGDWFETMKNLKEGKADVHSGLFRTEPRSKWLRFSQPFYGAGSFLFFKAERRDFLGDCRDLSGKKIGVFKDTYQEDYLRAHHPEAKITVFKECDVLIRAVLNNKLDALLAEGPTLASFLGKFGLVGKFETSEMLFKKQFHAGVLKNNENLLELIDMGFDSISNKELAEIEKHWIMNPRERYFNVSRGIIRLTDKEEKWLAEHPYIRVGLPAIFPPLYFMNHGKLKGIIPDYLKLVGDYSGIQFGLRHIHAKCYDDDLKSKKIDIGIGFDNPLRENYVSCTLPLMKITFVVVGRNDMEVISGLDALSGKSVAVVEGIQVYEQVLKNYPDIKKYPVPTFEDAVNAVLKGKADAVIGAMMMTGYMLHDHPGLRILGVAGGAQKPLRLVVRKDYPELVGIMNKVISSIPKQDMEDIIQKWFRVQVEHRTDWPTILRWLGAIAFVFTLILGVTIYWNKRLLREVRERIKVEQALRESEEKLARSKKMESLGMLAGGVAHDLNNILVGIVGYPDLMLMNLPEDSALREPVKAILESGKRAAAIVQDLLTVARGVANTKEVLNVNTVVEEYLDSPDFHSQCKSRPNVHVEKELCDELMNIKGASIHIRKAIMNLVVNALEAVGNDGHVFVGTQNRYVDRALKGYDDVSVGEYVVVEVADDGGGISPDDLERVFEPFYTKKVMGRSGTGLGLAVVWNVVHEHKGYIDVRTGKDGTTFDLYFPVTKEKPSQVGDEKIPIDDYRGDGERILIVDDEENQRLVTSKMLGMLGYQTEAVASGEEAVEYLKKHDADLLVLDMIMDPGMNGQETYAKVKAFKPDQKALIASGFAETDDVKKVQGMGAGSFLRKPFTMEKLGLIVKKELS